MVMWQEVAIMSMLEEHPHIISLKQVLYAPLRLYLVTGELPGSANLQAAGPLAAQSLAVTKPHVLAACQAVLLCLIHMHAL